MTNLFVYGALMYDQVWNRIVNGDFEKTKAQIAGYRRLAVKNEEYPGLVVGKGIVSGLIWYGIDDKNLQILDDFEGEYYERIPVIAINENGHSVEVNVYSFREEFHNLLDTKDWDVSEFEGSGLKKFVERYVGFEQMK